MTDMSDIAIKAEQDLNTYQKKQGVGKQSISAEESGVNEQVERDFPDADVRYGEKANAGGSDRKKIPPEEGGEIDAKGRTTQARHFQGPGGPEDKIRIDQDRRPGDDDVPTKTNFNSR